MDPDGRYFKKVIRKNTITIKATYYVKKHDKKSYRSAHLATEFWNNRQDLYISPSGKQYVVNYELTVSETDIFYSNDLNNVDTFKRNNNTYEVVKSFGTQGRAGSSTNKHSIQVLESYSETRPGTDTPSTTGAHEIGHTLGMSDGGVGIMSPSQDDSRTNDVTQENLQQMIDCDKGDPDWFSSFFPIK